MNKKQKIIVSVVGITIVLLTLLGLTYAYFLTRIQGNTNEKSISVTTANLELTYGDNSAEILGKDLTLIPSDNEIGTKTFTVTNNGNDTSYVVVIENVSVTKASDGSIATFESNDFRYTLTCTKSDGTSCDSVSAQSVFPINGGILVGNNIIEGDVHTYTFKMWYIDTGIDQSNDMGKHLQARINITNIESMANPYSSDKKSLAYNIIENAKNKTNGTELLSRTKTQITDETSYISTQGIHIAGNAEGFYDWNGLTYGDTQAEADGGLNVVSGSDDVGKCNSVKGKHISDVSSCNHKCSYIGIVKDCTSDGIPILTGSSESTMSITSDDYGISYYYRGHIEDNYVNFAGMCWRIVRINGDGSIKLILEDQDSTCATSDGNWNIPTETNGTTVKGNFGYTLYAANTLTASDGTQNSSSLYMMNYLNGGTNNNESMVYAFKNFQTGPLADYLSYLKAGDWCLDDKAYVKANYSIELNNQEILDKKIKGTVLYYASYVRLGEKTPKEPTLKCNGTNMSKFADSNSTDMYVGTLTADEIIYSGGKIGKSNPDYYLINNFQQKNSLRFWFLSPYYYSSLKKDLAFLIYSGGYVSNRDVYDNASFRPAVQLKSDIQISGGDGTISNPYEIAS